MDGEGGVSRAGEGDSQLRPQSWSKEGQGWTVADTEPRVRGGGLWAEDDRYQMGLGRGAGDVVERASYSVDLALLLSSCVALGSHVDFLDWGFLSDSSIPVQGGGADMGALASGIPASSLLTCGWQLLPRFTLLPPQALLMSSGAAAGSHHLVTPPLPFCRNWEL